MLINLRNALMAGKRKPTAKDYVQSGLVAMWDGIENAGWGTHDASATAWKDLAGNNDFTVAAGGILGDNYIGNGDTFNQIAYRGDFDFTDAPLTQEIVFEYANKQSDNSIILHIPQWHSSYSMLRGAIARVGQYFKFQTATSANVAMAATTQPVAVTTTYPSSTSAVSALYKNGAVASLVSAGSDGWYYNDAPNVCIGNRSTGGRGARIKVHRIAFYSRALTAEEIAANYKIDKARFNLP